MDPNTPIENLPCFTRGSLGASAVPDVTLSRDGQQLRGRLEVPDRVLTWLGCHEGAASPESGDLGPKPWRPPIKKATTVGVGTSRAYRELEATHVLVYHVLDPLRFYNILLQSEYCVMLHGASKLRPLFGRVPPEHTASWRRRVSW